MSEVNKIANYNQMMSWLTRPAAPKTQVADLADDLTPGPLKDELKKDFDPSQETHEEYLQRKALGERPFNAQDGGRVNLAIGGGAIEGEDLDTREGFRNPGINVHAKRLSKVKNYLDLENFAKLRMENKDKNNQEFADFLNQQGYKPDPKQAEKFSPVTIDRRYQVAKNKGLIPKDFTFTGSTKDKLITDADRKEFLSYAKDKYKNNPDKLKEILSLDDRGLNKKISDRRKFIKVQADDAKREAKNLEARKYRYETSRGFRGEEAKKKYEEYNIEQSRERRKNLNKYYRNPRDPKSLLWEDLLKRNEQTLNKPFTYNKNLPIQKYLDKNQTQKIVLTDKQGNKFRYDSLLEDIEKATGKPSDQVLKPYAQKSFLYQENLMPEINKQFGIKPGARDNPFHIQHIEGFQRNPFNVQLTFAEQNLAEARGKVSLEATFKNILKKEQKSPSYKEGTLYNYNKKKKAINKFYESLGPDIATQIGKQEVGNRTALVDLLDKTKIKIKPEVRERAMTLGAMGDVEMAKDILSKDFQTAKKLFGKYAPQIARGARQVTKLAVIPELAFGAAFAPLDLAEGRTGKETLLNVATLGMGIPIKDARDRADYVDQFGLKNDLFSAQMKATGLSQARGYGSGDPTSFELTDREKLALEKANEYDTNVLAPRLEEKLQERRAASDPEFGFREGIMNGGIMRLGFRGGGMDMGASSSRGSTSPSRGPAGGASRGGNYGGNKNSGPDRSKVSAQQERSHQAAVREAQAFNRNNTGPTSTPPKTSAYEKIKALGTVPLNLIGGIFGNPFNPTKPHQVINTKAQMDYLNYLANQKNEDTGTLSYGDYGTQFNLSDLKNPIAFSTAMTMGGTGYKKSDTGDITYTGGTYDFDGAVPFVDQGGLMGLAYRGGEYLANKFNPARLANGGRISFADGPPDPSKRKFVKVMAGLASLPILGRFLKPATKAIEAGAPVAEKAVTEAEKIFFNLVDAVKNKGIMDKLDRVTGGRLSGAYHEYKGAEVLEDGGSITARFKTDTGAPAEIVYIKPQKRIDPKTGKEVEYPGQFDYEAQEIGRINPEGDVDIDAEFEIMDSLEDVKKLIDD